MNLGDDLVCPLTYKNHTACTARRLAVSVHPSSDELVLLRTLASECFLRM